MSDINLAFTVNSYSTDFTVGATDLSINPVTTGLTVYSGFAAFPPGGAGGNTQVLYNDAGAYAGSGNLTFDNSTNTLSTTNLTVSGAASLGTVADITILGGSNGQFLQTDGNGNVSFSSLNPGGSNTQLQFNNQGVFGGVPNVTWNGTKLFLGNIGNLSIAGGTANYVMTTDGTGNVAWSATQSTPPGGSNTQIQLNADGLLGATANLTFNYGTNLFKVIGTGNITGGLTTSSISANSTIATTGAVTAGTNITATGNVISNNASIGNNVTVGGNITVTGNTTISGLTTTGLVNLGSINALTITGGSNTYVMTTDGAGGLSWVPQSGGSGNGVPGGITYSMQINAGSGNFAGANNVTYTTTTGTMNVQQIAEKVTLGGIMTAGTKNFDLCTQAILYYNSNSTGNIALNFRGNSTVTLDSMIDAGQSLTCTMLVKNGANGYYPTSFTIDSTSVTPIWATIAPYQGSANATDVYTFNIIKTAANTYTVLGSTGRFS